MEIIQNYRYYLEIFFEVLLWGALVWQCLEDLRHKLLYDSISFALALGGFAHSFFFADMSRSLMGGGIAFLCLAFLSLYRGGLGLGDLLLGSALGFWLGPELSIMMLILAFVLAAVLCALLWFCHLLERGLAFAPFLTLATFITKFYGSKIMELYLTYLAPIAGVFN